jgi:hypothetical protein
VTCERHALIECGGRQKTGAMKFRVDNGKFVGVCSLGVSKVRIGRFAHGDFNLAGQSLKVVLRDTIPMKHSECHPDIVL